MQQILQFLPLTLSTNFLVIVATPEIRLKKFRATRSLFKIALGFPYIVAIVLPLFIFFEFQIEFLKNDYLNLITTIVIGFMMISKIPTISIKKLKINPKYKTWIFLIFVLFCVALISRIWITLISVFGAYLISVFYTIIKSRNIKN